MNIKKSDDLLDVYALYQAKTQKLAEDSTEIIEQFQEQEDILAQIRDTNNTLRELLAELGVPADALQDTMVTPEACAPLPAEQIEIPADTDYHTAFEALVEEAHSKGFVNTSAEQLLSQEEMERALMRSKELDQKFSAATELQPEDAYVVMVGAGLHVLRHLLTAYVFAPPKQPDGAEDAYTGTAEEDESPLSKIRETFGTSTEVLRAMPFKREISIKTPERILKDAPCFRMVFDSRFPQQEDFLGNHQILGWIVGAFNIVTDTVTVRNFDTFQPDPLEPVLNCKLAQTKLTLLELMLPFIDHGFYGLESNVIAALIREAYVLIPNQVQYDDLSQCFVASKELYHTVVTTARRICNILPLEALSDALVDAGWANLINTLLIALHAILYKKDCNQDQYIIRTIRVVTAANFIGSVIGSLPALAANRLTQLDYAGALTGILNAASLTNLIVDAKAEFLASEYLTKLNAEIAQLDPLFSRKNRTSACE